MHIRRKLSVATCILKDSQNIQRTYFVWTYFLALSQDEMSTRLNILMAIPKKPRTYKPLSDSRWVVGR